MNNRCLCVIVLSIVLLECSTANESESHKLVKRQVNLRSGGVLPLSRSRQFPPPEELEESEEYENSESEEEKSPIPGFRGRQPPQAPPEEENTDDNTYTEAPKVTTPVPPKPTTRTVGSNRFGGRPRFGSQTTARSASTEAPKSSTSSSRSRATSAQSQRLDVVSSILNKPLPARSSQRSIANSGTANENSDKKAEPAVDAPTRRNSGNPRIRARGRPRTRTSSTTTTTTTTTTTKKPEEDYYYYYEDAEEAPGNQPIATTTSTTTTTTTARPRPSISRPRPVSTRSRSTSRPIVKFDPESQFAPPPDDTSDLKVETSSTKRFTTSSTMSPEESGGIPPHLRNKYRPRTDGRFIDFLRDPNRPRELKGHDLTDYPFYIVVPEDIDFECDDKKDGYYASIPHKCQLFHYCFAGARYDFLCANYTLYDQTTFTCRFANNVDCEGSAKYYYRNDDLWKETTTTPKPETTTRRRRKSTPKEEEYDEDYYYDDDEEDDEEQDRRRRPAKRRRNRRKNRRNQSDE